ncbi:MAG: phosphatase PAP2 family protein [Armatimonadetes bacterium]|nr:phosphatase PAP2 family protein [Armatimonadota bacterium]
MLRPKTPVDSFRHALNGLLLSFKTQRHLRIHFVVAVLVLGAGFVYRLNRAELLLLVGAISFVILAELLNTALETVVDLVTTDYHPLARVAKDVAAGAVLVAAVNAALFGLVLFLDVEQLRERLRFPTPVEDGIQTFAVGFVMLLLLLVIWKVKGGKGTFLRGGVVSGHTAIAFFLCTMILLLTQHPFVAFLAILIALLVAQSRVETGVHTLREVFFGALLGIFIPVLLQRCIPILLNWTAGRLNSSPGS